MTARYAIFGFPVKHSRSPAMHNAAFRALGLDASYELCEVRPEQLAATLAAMRGRALAAVDPAAGPPARDDLAALQGANVTLPHKTQVMALLDHVDPDARAIGAVNTLYRVGARIHGENTDAPGLASSLREANVMLTGSRVTVLGAGGAARATVVGLARAGASRITVCARREPEAHALVTDLRPATPSTELVASASDSSLLARTFADTDLLVQATSATLDDGPSAEPFARSLPLALLPEHAVVTDLVYKPRITRVLALAEARGLRTVDGLGMLLHQGALAFERWTGVPAAQVLGVMRDALSRAP